MKKDMKLEIEAENETSASNEMIEMENTPMNESDPRTPEEILNEIYKNLQGEDDVAILQAISSLKDLNYSSGAIRCELEWLAVKSENIDIRIEALTALNSTGNRAVQKRVNANKLERSLRFTLLNEISEWEII
ncbi:MAG: hypothetical protein KJZ72_19080 [Anaerolineales bacterium]|nr:hypothetical protein [Anaerolineales bacterium]